MKFANWQKSHRSRDDDFDGLGSFWNPSAFTGMLGMHGGYWTNMAMHRVDLLIAVGARFDDW